MYGFLAALFTGLLISGSAYALDRASALGLQMALEDHGFELGEPDGAIGPATRRAIRGFAEKHGLEATPTAVLSFMVEMSLRSRTQITDQNKLEKIRLEVSHSLRDPESSKIREVYKTPFPGGMYICGEVNGKNAYGAYAGYSQFHGMDILDHFAMLNIDGNSLKLSAAICATSFVVQD